MGIPDWISDLSIMYNSSWKHEAHTSVNEGCRCHQGLQPQPINVELVSPDVGLPNCLMYFD